MKKLDLEELESVLKITESSGTTNRADPTAWVRYEIELFEGHPTLHTRIQITECFGAVVADVYAAEHERVFISESVNEEFYPDIEAIYKRLWEGANAIEAVDHFYRVEQENYGSDFDDRLPRWAE